MRIIKFLLAGLAVLAFVAANLVFFQVDTTEYAVVTQFGEPVRAITAPGLYWKLPDPIQSVQRFDRRLQVYNLPQTEFLTQDKKNVMVESYTTWQVSDPVLFMKTVRDTAGAGTRLADVLTSELGVALGRYDLASLITVEAGQMQLPQMMAQVTARARERTAAYGLAVTDVRVKLLNFPEANKQSVFQRMRAERERIARQFRSEGTEEAAKIRATAEKERTTILSQAQKEADTIQGQGEAEAIRIYAEAFGQDAEFYQFLRSLQAYDKIIGDGTTLILPADSELLKYFNQYETASEE